MESTFQYNFTLAQKELIADALRNFIDYLDSEEEVEIYDELCIQFEV